MPTPADAVRAGPPLLPRSSISTLSQSDAARAGGVSWSPSRAWFSAASVPVSATADVPLPTTEINGALSPTVSRPFSVCR